MKHIIFILLIIFLMVNCNNKTQEEVFTHGGVVFERPVLISKGEIVYPDSLKAKNIKGNVLIKCTIDTLGRVKSAEIFKTPDDRLNRAALKSIETYTFSPGKQNNKKVEFNMLVSIEFD